MYCTSVHNIFMCICKLLFDLKIIDMIYNKQITV